MEQLEPGHTFTGLQVWYNRPYDTEIDREDLFRGLAFQSRYAGAVQPWSPLRHMALCARIACLEYNDPLTTGYAAAHDLHEAYLPNLPNHRERLCPEYVRLNQAWRQRVHEGVCLPYPAHPSLMAAVKAVDNRVVRIEAEMSGASDELLAAIGGDPMTADEKTLAFLTAGSARGVMAYVMRCVDAAARLV